MKLKKNQEEALKYARVARVATADRNGMPHVVPICPLFDNGSVYFSTDGNSKKARNIQENPQAAVVVDEYTEDWAHLRGFMIQGRAELLRPGAQFNRIRKLFYQKFPQFQAEGYLEGAGSVFVRIKPQHAFSWG